jgi:hypothetical protein
MTDYLRREIQAAAKWVRESVESQPARYAAKPGQFDTLECNLIRYFRGVAENEHEDYGKTRHVFDGYTLSLIFRRYKKRLRRIRYVGVKDGEVFGRLVKGEAWKRPVDSAARGRSAAGEGR